MTNYPVSSLVYRILKNQITKLIEKDQICEGRSGGENGGTGHYNKEVKRQNFQLKDKQVLGI